MRSIDMHYYCYLFEAKSIQSYLLATNRLKEIVGGSELIEWLTGDNGLFDKALAAVGGKFDCSRKGGGAAFAFTRDQVACDRLAALWPLLVAKFAPDLEFVQARGDGDSPKDAYDQATGKTSPNDSSAEVTDLRADRNRLSARLPQAGPFAARNRRSGEVAVSRSRSKKDPKPEPVDAVTVRKLLDDCWNGEALLKRFAKDSGAKQWPLNLNPRDADEGAPRAFPFLGEDQTIALVHADGNGLGQLLIDLANVADKEPPERFIPIFKEFSAAVTDATQRAAQRATTEVLEEPHTDKETGLYPARPIVLGGDDLTMLVRADLALPFTERFIAAFAEETGAAFKRLRAEQNLPLPNRLTACAGIAYARASQPFYLLHGLAEKLCKHAKNKAKATLPPRDVWKDLAPSERPDVPSAVAFHRVTTAFVDSSYDDILKNQLTFAASRRTHDDAAEDQCKAPLLRQTLECYAIEPHQELPWLRQLAHLQALLANRELARGPTRELLGLIGNDPQQAQTQYKRWRQLMTEGRVNPRHPALLKDFDDLLRNLTGSDFQEDLPYGAAADVGVTEEKEHLRCSPLGDVEVLRSVRNKFDLMMNAERQESDR